MIGIIWRDRTMSLLDFRWSNLTYIGRFWNCRNALNSVTLNSKGISMCGLSCIYGLFAVALPQLTILFLFHIILSHYWSDRTLTSDRPHIVWFQRNVLPWSLWFMSPIKDVASIAENNEVLYFPVRNKQKHTKHSWRLLTDGKQT